MFGEAVEVRTLGTTNWIHRFEISGGNRSLINPNAFSDPDTYQGTFWYTGAGDFGGVHTNSGVQNYWFYLLSDGGSGTNDNGNAFSVTGIGINKARLIAYQTMISLTTNSQYADARAVSIQAAKDLYGNYGDEAEATTRAWYAVGVGANWVTPTPLNITVSTSANYICPGSSATVTAFGASTYSWSGGNGTGNPKILSPVSTTTYTVTGTDAEACTGTKSFTIEITPAPTVTPTADDDDICEGASTTVRANTNGTLQNLTTPMLGGNGFAANVFDIQAYNSITITDFQMNISSGDSAVVYYKPGGYGNANVTDLTTWFKLGQTIAITPAGAGNQTLIPTTSNLTIPAGQTYGIIVACNGSNNYTNGTSVGSTLESNADLRITQGHGGSVFGSVSFPNAPRNFNGQVIYRTNFTSYSWSPSSTLSSATSSLPIATPTTTTTYTLTATDGNGCTGTGTVTVYVNELPSITSVSATLNQFVREFFQPECYSQQYGV
ncbi:MAG: M4 family metallopeptidase [Bacteroidota bacterium]|nr:MAG: M4 family metallopeptidase [Bacteroidota bacterium]